MNKMNQMNEGKVFKVWLLFITIVIAILIAIMFTMASHATSLDKNTVFKHNGKEFQTGSFIHNGRIFVPLRTLSQKLGYKVEWHGEDKTIGISKGSRFAQFQLGSKCIFVYNEDTVCMDVEPLVINGTTYIPVRYAVESLGKFIEFYEDEGIRVINITDSNPRHHVGK